METEAEIHGHLQDLSKISSTVNELSLYVDFQTQSEQAKDFRRVFHDLLTSQKEALSSVIDLYDTLIQAYSEQQNC